MLRTFTQALCGLLFVVLVGCGSNSNDANQNTGASARQLSSLAASASTSGGARVTPVGPRGRPTLNAAHTTFVADNGDLIRGVRYTTEWTGVTLPQSNIDTLKANGLNALHLYAEAYTAGYAAGTQASFVDQVVDITRENSLYLIITIGNGAGNGAFNRDYVMAFWQFYAARYANETHVIFEIQNEPYAWGPPYNTATLEMEKDAYKLIRSLAPNSPILLFSYSVMSSAPDALADIAALGNDIDWSNAAIAFHGYAGASSLAQQIPAVLAAGYPLFQTEFCTVPWGSGTWEYNGGNYIDADLAGILERNQVSWTSFTDVTRLADVVHKTQIDYAGLSWVPDFGNWPAARQTYGNNGKPWTLADLNSTLTIEAENYDAGAAGVTYADTDSGNSGGAYRQDDVDVAAATTASNGYYVTNAVAGEFLDYTVYLPSAGYYDFNLTLATDANCTIAVSARDKDVTGSWTINSTSNSWTTANRQVLLAGGQQRLRVAITGGACKLDKFTLSAVTSGYLPDGTYKVINANSNLALSPAGNAVGSNIDIVQSAYNGSLAQQWVFTHRGAGQYTLFNAAQTNNEKLTIIGDTLANAAGIQLWGEWWWGDIQTFIVKPWGNGKYTLLNTRSGLAVQIVNANSAAGAAVDQYFDFSGAHQQWLISTP